MAPATGAPPAANLFCTAEPAQSVFQLGGLPLLELFQRALLFQAEGIVLLGYAPARILNAFAAVFGSLPVGCGPAAYSVDQSSDAALLPPLRDGLERPPVLP